jgi:hypothetical protein
MHTRNREDIIRTAGLAFLRGTFIKDIHSLEALCFENHVHTRSEGTMIEILKKEMLMKSQNKGARNMIRGPDDVRLSVGTSTCFFSN